MNIDTTLKNSIFRVGIDEESQVRPLSTACIISISYIILISLYIWLSGEIAANLATTIEGLHQDLSDIQNGNRL